MAQYEELRSEMRQKIGQMGSRMSRGIASGGLITAYSFYTGDYILFSAVPVLIGFLIIFHMETFSWMIRISRQICIIQDVIGVDEFTWEKTYGMFGTNHTVHGLYSILSGIGVTIIYLISIFVSLEIAQRPEYSDTLFMGYPITQILEYSYGVLSLFMLVSGISTIIIWQYNKLDPLHTTNNQCPECEGEIKRNNHEIGCGDCEWVYPPDRRRSAYIHRIIRFFQRMLE